MRYIWLLTVLITSFVLYREAHAFDRCDAFLAGSSKIGAFLTEKVVHDEPLKFFDNARSIAIEIDPRSGGLLPRATFDEQGRPVVVFPSIFIPVLCRMVLATFLVLDGDDSAPRR